MSRVLKNYLFFLGGKKNVPRVLHGTFINYNVYADTVFELKKSGGAPLDQYIIKHTGLNGNPPANAVFINNGGAAFAPRQFMNFINNSSAVAQNVKGAFNDLLRPHFKYVKGHCFPLHFVNKIYVARIFCFAYCQKTFAVNR